MARLVFGLLAGVIVSIILVALLEMAGHMIFPAPEGLDLKDPETRDTLMAQIPFGAKAAVLVAWFFGALGGGIVAAFITKKTWSPWVIAATMLVLSGFTLTLFPHPVWMIVGAVILPVIAGWLASQFAPKTSTSG